MISLSILTFRSWISSREFSRDFPNFSISKFLIFLKMTRARIFSSSEVCFSRVARVSQKFLLNAREFKKELFRVTRDKTRRYTCSMQLEIKQREKIKRRRALQLMLFLKVSLIVGLVAACGVVSRVWKIPFLWTLFCAGHSLQVRRGMTHARVQEPFHFRYMERKGICALTKRFSRGLAALNAPFFSPFASPNDLLLSMVIFPL